MAPRSVISRKKKRGPAPTGKGEPILVRLQPDQLSALDDWIAGHDSAPSRPEAIRRLVEIGLENVQRARPSKQAASKATEMAGREIDRLSDQSATSEERATRKRRLIKGPSEFRDIRSDLPKQTK